MCGQSESEGVLPGVIDRAWRRGRRERAEEAASGGGGGIPLGPARGTEDGGDRESRYSRDVNGAGAGAAVEGKGQGREEHSSCPGLDEGREGGSDGGGVGGDPEGFLDEEGVRGDGHVCGEEAEEEEQEQDEQEQEQEQEGEDEEGEGEEEDCLEEVDDIDDRDHDIDESNDGSNDVESNDGRSSVDNEGFESDVGRAEGGMPTRLTSGSFLSARCESEVFGFAGSVVSTLDDSGSPRSDDGRDLDDVR